jgi:hypothetical protein
MKMIRTLTTLAGLSLVLLALGATGARAQGSATTNYAGSFTLPLEAQWGAMTLPAGNYSLYYGHKFLGGAYLVEVVGKTEGSPHGMIPIQARNDVSSRKNSLICIRDGDSLVVRKLELPAIGESVSFAMPHGLKLLARKQRHGKYILAEAPMLIQRVPVQMNGK